MATPAPRTAKRASPADRDQAARECALVTRCLADGFPAEVPAGSTRHSAVYRAARELGVPRLSLARRIGTHAEPGSHHRLFGLAPDWSIAAARGELGTDPVLPGYEIAETVTLTDADGDVRRRSVRQRRAPLRVAGDLPPGHVLKGLSRLTDGQGRVIAEWQKTREGMSPADMVEAIRAAFEGFSSRAVAAPAPASSDADTATVYGLADLHLGLLTWHRETAVNWDLAIAQRVIRESIGRLVAAAPPSRQAVVLGLGDLLHADGYDNCTPRSKNVLDVDGRYPKILKAATYLMIEAVEAALGKHERVLVRVLRGNHDRESAIAVALALSLHYGAHPRVTVDDDPGYFWWWRFGRVLLGATHGDAAKMADLPLIMAARNAEAWGASAFRHILTGHVHTRTAIEVSGVTVESLQTPIPPDAWHVEQGYGAGRSLTAITYHAEDGEVSRAKVNVRAPKDAP